MLLELIFIFSLPFKDPVTDTVQFVINLGDPSIQKFPMLLASRIEADRSRDTIWLLQEVIK